MKKDELVCGKILCKVEKIIIFLGLIWLDATDPFSHVMADIYYIKCYCNKKNLVVLDILLLLQVKSCCDSNLKIGKLLQQHKLVAITYNSSLH
jgi:hypothetical protein